VAIDPWLQPSAQNIFHQNAESVSLMIRSRQEIIPEQYPAPLYHPEVP